MRLLLLSLHVSFSLATSSGLAADPPPEAKTAPVFQMRLVLDAAAPDSEEMLEMTSSDNPADWPTLHVQKAVLLDHTSVKSASVEQEAGADPRITIQFTDKGAERFEETTRQNVGKRLAIIMDGTLWSAPRIMDQIRGGSAAISGKFTAEQAQQLADKISRAAKKP